MTTIVSPAADAVLDTPGGELPLTCHLSYNTEDPIAVSFRFLMQIQLDNGCIARDVQSWTCARDLLSTAMATPDTEVGQGDVRLQYLHAQHILVMTLLDLDGHSHDVYIDASVVPGFMADAAHLLPPDAEVNVVDDDEIARLMEAGE